MPARATDCPHCDAPFDRSPGGASARAAFARATRAMLGVATGGAVAMTLMACYGMPPCEDENDANCFSEGGGGGAGGAGGGSTASTTTTAATGGAGGAVPGEGGAGGG